MRTLLKNLVCGLAEGTGLNAALRAIHRHRLLVLCYHGVVADEQASSSFLYRNTLSATEFEAQMRALQARFEPISLDDLLAACRGERGLPQRAALVTFDDGYENNLTRAAPVLERVGVPALFCVATGYIGTDRLLWPQELELRLLRWPKDRLPVPEGPDRDVPAPGDARVALTNEIRALCKRLPDEARERYLDRLRAEPLGEGADRELLAFLSWDQVRELRRRGFAIGSHTVEHPILTRIPPDRLEQELAGSRAAIEREVGAPCLALAYPNGGRADFSAEVQAAARAAGYAVAFALTEGANAPRLDPFAIDRVCAPAGVSRSVFLGRLGGIHALLR